MKKAQNQHTKTKNKAPNQHKNYEIRKNFSNHGYFSCYNCFKSKEAVKNDI
jgi:hypothetical protein